MGNTPSQQPFESDSEEGVASAPERPLAATVVRATRSVVAAVGRRVRAALPSALAGTRHGAAGDEPSTELPRPQSAQLPQTSDDTTRRSMTDVPARETPFTRPADDDGDDNGPDLRATESDGNLAIYHPDCPGASIESDTWERVER